VPHLVPHPVLHLVLANGIERGGSQGKVPLVLHLVLHLVLANGIVTGGSTTGRAVLSWGSLQEKTGVIR
jgi:hypothetical protein